MNCVYWFRRDRRLSDNPAFSFACQTAQSITPVIIRETPETTEWGFDRVGKLRLTFESHATSGLALSLRQKGSDLYVPHAEGVSGLIEVCEELKAREIICESISAPEELVQVRQLERCGLRVRTFEQSTLLHPADLPFQIQDTPTIFSTYRQQIERLPASPRTPLPAPGVIPAVSKPLHSASPYESIPTSTQSHWLSSLPDGTVGPYADEAGAHRHLGRYFGSNLPHGYKSTRNQLTGTDYSTKFSPWLAIGAISPRQIWARLKVYEHDFGENESTYWIWFELLWRDHFRLMMQRFGNQLFRRSGIKESDPSSRPQCTSDALERWREARTGHDLIDAAMRELAQTGYLSNRLRQIVASYLIHDLGGDWLGGAAWFEHCLVDFDVHSNQGNWAYIAGVGTDPRGGRRFNIDKQIKQYDGDGQYRNLWSSTQ